MKSSSEFQDFAARLLEMKVGETTKAIGCLWFADNSRPGAEMTVRELADCMRPLA